MEVNYGAKNPNKEFSEILLIKQTKRDRETFEQWYLQTYQQKFSWEAYLQGSS
ncbi:hypothetical protein [Spiroplasma poulsonii]|uniref:hypothetical protein n=1 Tax=Spiroplasma poulsonii TaxID=2138 RepID=UPI001F4D271D|nr:hypothetical protein [Spiroplasma poulsonii]UNF62150.1 hypothetical protein MNU24_01415 [Spiroplasma poulsonii]